MESWIGLGELLVRVSAYGGCPARGASCGFTASAEVSVCFVASYQSFVCWCDGLSAYRASMLWERHNKKNEEIAAAGEESEGLDLSWPSTGRGRLTYIIWAPIIIPLALTIYDCRKPKYVK